MSEHPILFSGSMIEAILEGCKTQTRRVIIPQPPGYCDYFQRRGDQPGHFRGYMSPGEPTDFLVKSRYGNPGDILWVREKWQAQNTSNQWWHEVPKEDRPLWNWAWTNPVHPAYEATPPKWLPSIHMPREACRIELEIMDIRIEQVQKITWEDCIAEGAPFHSSDALVEDHAIMWYSELWNSINTARGYGWDVNPWVWVIEFRSI